ncbi:hypothetical protein FCN77_16300 [Arthrobacter sp. 24S4-2]|uniref:hypothetical protein n=1 Tax=Arthrobacter sp. 24S4-2 TaxID=2575374 RepID=UPI0010C7BEC2|nr:hypothetical protein [Arthrobacter sp. 24S4-2]QCO98976.1 hypothetical protein FCN77_16300 [Arthrobacter sp. 24S4-2]
MDAETLKMIVTAGAGISGALLGSGLTGFINMKNAKASRDADKEMWELRREHEINEARRNEKRELYLTFNEAKQELTDLIIDAHFSNPQHALDEPRCMEIRGKMSTATFAVSMLPETSVVTSALIDVMNSQGDLMCLVDEAISERRGIDEEKFQAASNDFWAKSATALVLMNTSLSGQLNSIEKYFNGPGELARVAEALKNPGQIDLKTLKNDATS